MSKPLGLDARPDRDHACRSRRSAGPCTRGTSPGRGRLVLAALHVLVDRLLVPALVLEADPHLVLAGVVLVGERRSAPPRASPPRPCQNVISHRRRDVVEGVDRARRQRRQRRRRRRGDRRRRRRRQRLARGGASPAARRSSSSSAGGGSLPAWRIDSPDAAGGQRARTPASARDARPPATLIPSPPPASSPRTSWRWKTSSTTTIGRRR